MLIPTRSVWQQGSFKSTVRCSKRQWTVNPSGRRPNAFALRRIIPEEFFAKWAHQHLPRTDISPLDVLQGENGFDEFVSLLESIVAGDFS